jgi:protoporphyrinogen/coproporphyrinogen III oxidase
LSPNEKEAFPLNSTPIDVIVIGAGIAGLTAAYRARQAGRSVLVFEKAARPGGPIRSERVDGYLLEYGPNTVQPKGEMMSLILELGIDGKMLLADPRMPRFVRFNGALHAVPNSPAGLLKTRLLSLSGRLRLLAEPFVPRLAGDGDESLLGFARRRLGGEVAERLVSPFVSGVWAGDPDQLSAVSSFPRLRHWESRHGSLLRGALAERRRAKGSPAVPRGLLSFYDGLETLPRALAETLGTDLRLGSGADEIAPEQPAPAETIWRVRAGGEAFLARNVVLATPAHEAAGLLSRFAPAAASALEAMPYVPVAALHLGFRQELVGHRPNGFGFLTVPSESPDILGCLWSSSLFGGRAPDGHHLFTVFMGGARRRDLLSLPDNELLNRALGDLQPTMRLTGRPSFIRVTRFDRAIPQYTLGHGRRLLTLAKTEKLFPGLKFAGNYLEGISVGDVIRQATTLVGSEL